MHVKDDLILDIGLHLHLSFVVHISVIDCDMSTGRTYLLHVGGILNSEQLPLISTSDLLSIELSTGNKASKVTFLM